MEWQLRAETCRMACERFSAEAADRDRAWQRPQWIGNQSEVEKSKLTAAFGFLIRPLCDLSGRWQLWPRQICDLLKAVGLVLGSDKR